MSYDARFDMCRRIRMMEYDGSGADELKRDIDSSSEFNQDEKDFLYFCMNKFRSKQATKPGLSEILQQYLPYALAAGLGYGARLAQEKIGVYTAEGEKKAREEIMKQNSRKDAKTSS